MTPRLCRTGVVWEHSVMEEGCECLWHWGRAQSCRLLLSRLRQMGHLQELWGNAEREREQRKDQQPTRCAWFLWLLILLKVWERQIWQQHRSF